MIVCKKCGEKYEDDMPRCLWCDALNPEHPLNRTKVSTPPSPTQVPATPEVSPTLNETATVIEQEQDQDAAIEQQFRQKGLLWSVVLAGVFVSWLCHYKYLKKGDKFGTKFFLPLFGIQCGFRYLAYMLSKIDLSGIGSPGLFLQGIIIVVVCLLYWFFIGKLGIVLLKKAVPNYNPVAFKKRERVGIAVGIPIFALDFIAGYLHYGTTAKMLGTWLGSALR